MNTVTADAVVSPAPITASRATSHANLPAGYDPRLTNEDLAPLKAQTWGQYNIFAFWMSDVHSVGGYITAGSLFALGLSTGARGEFARPPAKPYTGLLSGFQLR